MIIGAGAGKSTGSLEVNTIVSEAITAWGVIVKQTSDTEGPNTRLVGWNTRVAALGMRVTSLVRGCSRLTRNPVMGTCTTAGEGMIVGSRLKETVEGYQLTLLTDHRERSIPPMAFTEISCGVG
jgi:hypothetical protein